MQLLSLSQLNFRNLLSPNIKFSGGIQAIVGDNAAGKSNLLQAVYLCASGYSLGSKMAELIRLGQEEGFVAIEFSHLDGLSRVEVGLNSQQKLFKLDGQSIRATQLAKRAAAVMIRPEDVSLIHGSPSERREFLDQVLSKLSLRYALILREYQRVVDQRNALLKQAYAEASLGIWNEKFIELGNHIMELRLRAVKRMSALAQESYHHISGQDKVLSLRLQSGEGVDLAESLKATRQEERQRGVTVVGPHRDDVVLELNQNLLQSFGSRGEARSSALALRIAEYHFLKEKHQEEPLLLIDDFSAELDPKRRSYLLSLAAQTPQSLISGTEAPPSYNKLFHIQEGIIKIQ
ncbi:MAG: DNA replication and repair protein RecF [Deinococcales bacterium]